MVIGVSTRKYRRALEDLPPEVKERGTSKSAVSRRFIIRVDAGEFVGDRQARAAALRLDRNHHKRTRRVCFTMETWQEEHS